MVDYGIEENEELAALKKWWQENGVALVLGLVVGIAAIVGWQGWQAWQENYAQGAATAYAELQQALAGTVATDKLAAMVEHLQAEYGASPYAAQAGLALAEQFVIQNQPDRAIASLHWVATEAEQTALRNIARVRQARLVWGQGNPDAALELLQHEHPTAFVPLYAELVGDIEAATGDQAGARDAYRKALTNLPPGGDRTPLQRKLNAVSDSTASEQPEVS